MTLKVFLESRRKFERWNAKARNNINSRRMLIGDVEQLFSFSLSPDIHRRLGDKETKKTIQERSGSFPDQVFHTPLELL